MKPLPGTSKYRSFRCGVAGLALLVLKLGNLDAAIADYDAALNAKPQLDSALYCRGLAKRRKGDIEGAERDIAAAKTITAGIADRFAHYGVE